MHTTCSAVQLCHAPNHEAWFRCAANDKVETVKQCCALQQYFDLISYGGVTLYCNSHAVMRAEDLQQGDAPERRQHGGQRRRQFGNVSPAGKVTLYEVGQSHAQRLTCLLQECQILLACMQGMAIRNTCESS